jgi:hypothetical protein
MAGRDKISRVVMRKSASLAEIDLSENGKGAGTIAGIVRIKEKIHGRKGIPHYIENAKAHQTISCIEPQFLRSRKKTAYKEIGISARIHVVAGSVLACQILAVELFLFSGIRRRPGFHSENRLTLLPDSFLASRGCKRGHRQAEDLALLAVCAVRTINVKSVPSIAAVEQ